MSYLDTIVSHLLVSASKDKGRTATEIAEATGAPLSTVYRLLKTGDTVGIATIKSHPKSFYVDLDKAKAIAEKAIYDRETIADPSKMSVEDTLMVSSNYLLQHVSKENIVQLKKTMSGPIDIPALLDAMLAGKGNVRSLTLQAVVLIYHCYRRFLDDEAHPL